MTKISLSTRILFTLTGKPHSANELSRELFEPVNVIGARLNALNQADMIVKSSGQWSVRQSA